MNERIFDKTQTLWLDCSDFVNGDGKYNVSIYLNSLNNRLTHLTLNYEAKDDYLVCIENSEYLREVLKMSKAEFLSEYPELRKYELDYKALKKIITEGIKLKWIP